MEIRAHIYSTIFLAVVWTVTVGGLYVWNKTHSDGHMVSHGLTWALGIFGIVIWYASGVKHFQKHAQARDELIRVEISSKIKSEFMSSMSHELRTPLNAIIGFSQTMKEGVFGKIEGEKNREYLNDIHNSGQHLLSLINDMLDISALEAGALMLDEHVVDMGKTLEACTRLVLPRAEKGKVIVKCSWESSVPDLIADERRVKQVFLNLLSNAVKFTPPGGEVSISASVNSNGSLAIEVEDTGIGMSQPDIAVALSRFGQVNTGLESKQEGTGLGLPLAKELMELHGGTLAISSEKGKGTNVVLAFPADRIA